MSDPIPPEQPEERDSWKKLAEDFADALEGAVALANGLGRRDALLAEDEHPATPSATRDAAIEIARATIRSIRTAFGNMAATEAEPVVDALIAAGYIRPAAPVDEHLPKFHVRPVWIIEHPEGFEATPGVFPKRSVLTHEPTEVDRLALPGKVTKNWRWGAKTNGEVVIPESQALEHRSHALKMAHQFADPMGARVVDQDGNDV